MILTLCMAYSPCYGMCCNPSAISNSRTLASGDCHVQTLSDSQMRATYDAIVGFSDQGMNPFSDRSADQDRVRMMTVHNIWNVGKCGCLRWLACPEMLNPCLLGYFRALHLQSDSNMSVQEGALCGAVLFACLSFSVTSVCFLGLFAGFACNLQEVCQLHASG